MRYLLPVCLFITAPVFAQSAPLTVLPPAKPAESVLPGNMQRGGPPIPTTPPKESDHPPAVVLWPNGAPGSEARKGEPEIVGWRQEIDIVFPIIYNIHNPSITPFLPTRDKATGCAVIIAPGGGHMFQTIDREGYDLAKWLADHGVAAFVLKYRLARDNATPQGTPQPYQVVRDAGADALRAVRVVRSRAAEWGVDPNRVGFIGFSAGAEVAMNLGLGEDQGDPNAADPIDKLDAHPNFLGLVYGGSQQARAADWVPPTTFPPSFLLCSSTDPSPGVSGLTGMAKFYLALKAAKIPVELHIFEEGGHGFGVRQWDYSVATWPTLFRGWLNDRGYLKKAADPQADLKTVIPDLVRYVRANDTLTEMQTYTQPAIWAKIGPEYTRKYLAIVQPKVDSAARDPEMARRERMITDPIAGSYEALENQTPTFNATGDEATYIYTQSTMADLVNGTYTGTSTGPKVPLVFIKINGKWYFKQPPEIPQERSI